MVLSVVSTRVFKIWGQRITNKYIDTKFRAEKAVLEAAADGMKGRVIRFHLFRVRDIPLYDKDPVSEKLLIRIAEIVHKHAFQPFLRRRGAAPGKM